MTSEQIEKFLETEFIDAKPVAIRFKARQAIKGLFIKTKDFSELKGKNLWRIVNESKLEQYEKSKDADLARIFNGAEFVKLTPA